MGSSRCHGEMTQRLHIAAGVLFFAASILGCEDAGKKPAQAHVAALAPAPQAANAKQAAVELAPLPILNPPRRHYVWLLPPVPSGKDYLIQKVQEKFISGEQNFKAGHLEAARKDFDEAAPQQPVHGVVKILARGFQMAGFEVLFPTSWIPCTP